MNLHPLPDSPDFRRFSLLVLDEEGRFLRLGDDRKKFKDAAVVGLDQLDDHLKRQIVLPKGVTDVFVWVHGWRTDLDRCIVNAQRLFHGIETVHTRQESRYARIGTFVPAFLAVHWPSMSNPFANGYRKIRNRTSRLTEEGLAEFFLASLLGYLDEDNEREGNKVLRARGGYYIHCVGHSFGGRFLTAAIGAAANPTSPKTLSLLGDKGFAFTVDSLCVFQMAAGCRAFGPSLESLVSAAPLSGPIALTFSHHDEALCTWHKRMENEVGIGCSGAVEPSQHLSTTPLLGLDQDYTFAKPILNVDATAAFARKEMFSGAHSDFWYEESIHLLLSLSDFCR